MTPFVKKCLKYSALALLVFAFIGPCKHKYKRSDFIDENLPKLNVDRSAEEIASPHMSPIIQLFREGEFYCTAFVISNNYALTAGHCLSDDEGLKTKDVIDIRLNNKHILDAKAVGVYYRRDLGLIQGDFRKFDMIEAENEHPGFQAGEPILTCGYPGGNKNWSCTTFAPAVNDGFMLKGPGLLQPGMSGGPAINIITNKAVGVNCQVYMIEQGGGVGIASLYGVLGHFGIEP
jgi:S1-C subfamily serine protease